MNKCMYLHILHYEHKIVQSVGTKRIGLDWIGF